MSKERAILLGAQVLLLVAVYRFGYVSGYGDGGHAVIDRMTESAQPWIDRICGRVAV